jgi:chemosensory pili system protein ChpA (sensor histidine kinase/response regulator)
MMRDLETSAVNAFAGELATSLPEIRASLEAAERDPRDLYPVREAHRLFHALKGAASMVGLAALGYLLNQAEDLLDPIVDGESPVETELLVSLRSSIPKIAEYMDAGLAGTSCLSIARDLSRIFRRAAGDAALADDTVLTGLLEVDARELALSKAAAAPPAEVVPAPPDALPFPIMRPQPGDQQPTASRGAADARNGDTIGIGADDSISAFRILQPAEPPPAPPRAASAAAEESQGTGPEPIPPELAEVFAQEAQDHLQAIARLTTQLSPTAPDRDGLQELRRAVHTLKGAAGVVGYTAVARLSHRMEDLLDALYDGLAELTPESVRLLASSSDALDDLISGATRPQAQDGVLERLFGQFDALGPVAPAPPVEEMPEPVSTVSMPAEPPPPARPAEPPPDVAVSRPAVAERRRGSEDRRDPGDVVRVPLQRLNELVRLMTDLVVNRATFEQHYAGLIGQVEELKLSTARLRRVAQKLETNYEARALGGNLTLRTVGGAGASAGSDGFDELEFDRYTDFHLLTRELAETASDIATVGARVADTVGDFDTDITHLGRVTRDIQDKVMEFRMVPLRTLASRLERAVRVTAEACGKSVEFVLEGQHVAMDKSLLQEMADPLMHLLRNAVDHGIEAPAEREEAGKPLEGRIAVRAYHEGTDVILEVEDDGKGLDLERIRRTIVERGYVDEAEAAGLDGEALTSFVFEPGFSTAGRVTEISGRGVGLDIVKAKVVRLNGRIRIVSRPGAGATVVVRVPMTLAITRILLFRAGNELLGLPLGAVVQIVRPHAAAIVPLGSDRVVTVSGHTYPVRDLADSLGLPHQSDPTRTARPLLIANLAGRHVALEIDEILTSRDAVVKTLGTHLRRVVGVWGATLLGDGTVVLILNPADLGGVAEKPRPRAAVPRAVATEREPYTILVVDDSLSMRHVLSAAVRRAGWIPVQARDGIEALEAVHRAARPPDLILLDIEMPRMDGYEFLATIRGQKVYSSLPIVMLTSRGGEKHREKAYALGATDYVVKPFQEDALTERISRLIQANRNADRKAAS